MDWNVFARALALVMIIEGLVPFAAPTRWRQAMLTIAGMDGRIIRLIGLFSMLTGLAALNFLS